MLDIQFGQIVFSKQGRDKGNPMIVIEVQNDYVCLVDGKRRTLEKPKKKKIKHIQPTNFVVDIKTDGRELQDADIRKQLSCVAATKGGNPHWQKTT